MAIEYWLLSISIIVILIFPIKSKGEYSVRLILSLLLLFIYGAFRVNYGPDYTVYENFFDGVKNYGHAFNERMELGYFYLNKILPTFRSLLIIQTLLLCTAYYFLFKWYVPAKWAWLGFFLLFLNGQFTVIFMLSAVRNGMAISIFILSTYYIYKKKIIPFSLLIFIAFLLHTSVIIYAPIAYIIANGKTITKRSIKVWLTIMIIIGVSSSTIILDYVGVFTAKYFDRYITYYETIKETGQSTGLIATLFSFTLSGMLLFYFKDKKLKPEENMIVKFAMLFFLSYLMGSLNMRMTHFFAPFFMLVSLMFLYIRGNKLYRYVYLFVVFIYLYYSMKIWIASPYFTHDTYHSILF